MGLSVTGSLLGIRLEAPLGAAVTVLAAGVLLILVAGAVRAPRFSDIPAWSMMTMGVLALGSAADTTFGWSGAHAVTWVLGSVAAVVVLMVQGVRFLRGEVPATFPGVLPLVTPMVAATNAAQLGHPLPGVLCFAASLLTAVPAFARVYLCAGRRPPAETAAATWIPLGVVGQSSAAALLLTDGATVGVVYAVTVLCLGFPAAGWAAVNHWGALLHRPMPNPSWWAATFPVGTCSLGTHTLAAVTGVAWVDAVSAGLLLFLCIHVALAAIGTASAVRRRHLG
jgi:tellurite resistance protein TehA-like permease